MISRSLTARLMMTVFLSLFLGYALITVFARPAPSLQDYPDWVYQGFLFSRRLVGHPVAGYVLKHYPVPNSLTTIGIGIVTAVVGWQLAAKLWVLCVLGLLMTGALAFVRALKAQPATLVLMAPTVLLGIDLWNGSVNFDLGLGLLLWMAALLVRSPRPSFALGVLLLMIFFSHMLPCAAALLLIGAIAIQQRSWRWAIVALPTLVCTMWYALSRGQGEKTLTPLSSSHLVPAVVVAGGLVLWASWRQLSAKAVRIITAIACVAAGFVVLLASVNLQEKFHLLSRAKLISFGGSFGPLEVIGDPAPGIMGAGTFTVLACVGVVLACVSAWRLWTAWMEGVCVPGPVQHVAIASLALGVLFLLAPVDALGVTAIDARFLHLGLCLGLPLLGLRASRWTAPLAACLALICAVNCYQFARVQLGPRMNSLEWGQHSVVGTLSVNPAMRTGCYQDIRDGHLTSSIFPTAMFDEYKP